MSRSQLRLLLSSLLMVLAGGAFGSSAAAGRALPRTPEAPTLNPEIARLLESISAESLRTLLTDLTSFETRHTFSDTSPEGDGIGAAREHIRATFESWGGRLEVGFDSYQVQADGRRVRQDADLRNVVARLPARATVVSDGVPPRLAERRIVIGGHYDSLAFIRERMEDVMTGRAPAPGADDDGSGTVLVMELARVMASLELEATIDFVAFAGEEIGLVGSTLMAQRLKKEGINVEAMITNDIVGSPVGGDGQADNTRVRVFSDGPEDSRSRALARYFRRQAHAYLPFFEVDTIFRYDRFGRGGDHTPFVQEGYAGVRVTESHETYARQHTLADTLDSVDFDYLAQVTRANAAMLVSLASAPAPPNVYREGRPMLSRGEGRYAAHMQWEANGEDDLAGYVVVMRNTRAPFWERSWAVGNVTEFELTDVSIDDWTFGVMAVDTSGNESLVSSYVYPQRERRTYEVAQ